MDGGGEGGGVDEWLAQTPVDPERFVSQHVGTSEVLPAALCAPVRRQGSHASLTSPRQLSVTRLLEDILFGPESPRSTSPSSTASTSPTDTQESDFEQGSEAGEGEELAVEAPLHVCGVADDQVVVLGSTGDTDTEDVVSGVLEHILVPGETTSPQGCAQGTLPGAVDVPLSPTDEAKRERGVGGSGKEVVAAEALVCGTEAVLGSAGDLAQGMACGAGVLNAVPVQSRVASGVPVENRAESAAGRSTALPSSPESAVPVESIAQSREVLSAVSNESESATHVSGSPLQNGEPTAPVSTTVEPNTSPVTTPPAQNVPEPVAPVEGRVPSAEVPSIPSTPPTPAQSSAETSTVLTSPSAEPVATVEGRVPSAEVPSIPPELNAPVQSKVPGAVMQKKTPGSHAVSKLPSAPSTPATSTSSAPFSPQTEADPSTPVQAANAPADMSVQNRAESNTPPLTSPPAQSELESVAPVESRAQRVEVSSVPPESNTTAPSGSVQDRAEPTSPVLTTPASSTPPAPGQSAEEAASETTPPAHTPAAPVQSTVPSAEVPSIPPELNPPVQSKVPGAVMQKKTPGSHAVSKLPSAPSTPATSTSSAPFAPQTKADPSTPVQAAPETTQLSLSISLSAPPVEPSPPKDEDTPTHQQPPSPTDARQASVKEKSLSLSAGKRPKPPSVETEGSQRHPRSPPQRDDQSKVSSPTQLGCSGSTATTLIIDPPQEDQPLSQGTPHSASQVSDLSFISRLSESHGSRHSTKIKPSIIRKPTDTPPSNPLNAPRASFAEQYETEHTGRDRAQSACSKTFHTVSDAPSDMLITNAIQTSSIYHQTSHQSSVSSSQEDESTSSDPPAPLPVKPSKRADNGNIFTDLTETTSVKKKKKKKKAKKKTCPEGLDELENGLWRTHVYPQKALVIASSVSFGCSVFAAVVLLAALEVSWYYLAPLAVVMTVASVLMSVFGWVSVVYFHDEVETAVIRSHHLFIPCVSRRVAIDYQDLSMHKGITRGGSFQCILVYAPQVVPCARNAQRLVLSDTHEEQTRDLWTQFLLSRLSEDV